MEFWNHSYNPEVTGLIDNPGQAIYDGARTTETPPEAWMETYREINNIHGICCPAGSRYDAIDALRYEMERHAEADGNTDDNVLLDFFCTKPGAFTGVKEYSEDWLRKFAAALAYDVQQDRIVNTHMVGPVKCAYPLRTGSKIIRSPAEHYREVIDLHGERWSAHYLTDQSDLYGAPNKHRPVPNNAITHSGDYHFSDTVAHYSEYAAKTITWQEAYALYFEVADVEPTEDNIETTEEEDPRLLLANYLWIKRNKPTYRLWPDWTQTFTQSKMIEFPTNLYVQPYTSIVILLPRTRTRQAPLTFHPHAANTESMIYSDDPNEIEPVSSIQLTVFNNDSFRGTAFKGQHLADEHHSLHLYAMTQNIYYDNGKEKCLNEPGPCTHEILTQVQCTLPLNTDLSLTEQLDKYDLPQEYRDIWSVALTVAYLGTCQYKLIEPDVLNKDIPRYLKALEEGDLSRVSQLHAKATKRRRHLSYNVGKNTDSIIRILGKTSKSSKNNGEPKRELKFRHIRRFHFRHINKGKSTEKVIPIMEIIVRPDLPEKEYNINFRSLDDEDN